MKTCVLIIVLFAASTCFGATIEVVDGDHLSTLTVGYNDSLEMTGGVLEEGKFFGETHEIDGGVIGVKYTKAIQHDVGVLNVRGGDWENGIFRSYDVINSTINFFGKYFRYTDAGLREYNSYKIEGFLSDGSFMSIIVANNTERRRTDQLPINFIIEPSDPLAGDVNGDWSVDLFDLNTMRNNFGEAGNGDLDGNGVVDLADLNETRNSFGMGSYTLPLDDRTIEVRESRSVSPNTNGGFLVPEPDSSILLVLAVMAVGALALKCLIPDPPPISTSEVINEDQGEKSFERGVPKGSTTG